MGSTRRIVQLMTLMGVLTLGAVGVYRVVSIFVNRRRREWVIKMALGMKPIAAAGQVATRGAMLVSIGSAIGVAHAPCTVSVCFAIARLLGIFGRWIGARIRTRGHSKPAPFIGLVVIAAHHVRPGPGQVIHKPLVIGSPSRTVVSIDSCVALWWLLSRLPVRARGETGSDGK
jgi:hypothetical protein